MIARHETHLDKTDIWSALAAPLPPGVISWRQDGRTVARDGRCIARFVAYIEANTVRKISRMQNQRSRHERADERPGLDRSARARVFRPVCEFLCR